MGSAAPHVRAKRWRIRSLFISDTHLLSKNSQADVLHEFLARVRCEYLYLVGDILDLWHSGKHLHWPPVYNSIFRRILKLAAGGTRVIYVPGNHDELLRKLSGYQLGNIAIEEKTEHACLDGRTLLVIHGDQFDSLIQNHRLITILGGTGYASLLRLNRLINWLRRLRGLPYLSISSKIKGRVKRAVAYVEQFERILVMAAKKEELDGVVCGHIHQPAMKEIEGTLYLNCGDFVENCTAIVEDLEGVFRILDVHVFLQSCGDAKPENPSPLDTAHADPRGERTGGAALVASRPS